MRAQVKCGNKSRMGTSQMKAPVKTHRWPGCLPLLYPVLEKVNHELVGGQGRIGRTSTQVPLGLVDCKVIHLLLCGGKHWLAVDGNLWWCTEDEPLLCGYLMT